MTISGRAGIRIMLFLQQAIFTGAIFSLILAALFFFVKSRRVSLYFMFVLLLAMAVTQFFAWFNISGIRLSPHWLNFVFIGFNYFIGPSVYFVFTSTLDANFAVARRVYLSYLPGVLAILVFPIIALASPALLPQDPQQYFHGRNMSTADYLLALAFLQNNVYYYMIYRRGSAVMNFASLKSESSARLFLSLFVVIGLINIYGLIGYALRDIIHMYIASAAITGIIISFFWFSQRYPEFFLDLESAIETAKESHGSEEGFKKSSLEKINLKHLHLDLVEVMNTQRLYMEDDLTLNKVAEKLGIKPYQLSEFMNKHLKINFSQFVNRFRVEKAKRLLLEEDDVNILSVAFKVGFNSKANFNLSFSSIVGKSPRAYMKEKKEETVQG